MKDSDRLGSKRIISLLYEFSIPSIVGMLVNALYNVIDRIYVGQSVGTYGISALALVFPVQLIIFGCIMLIGVGGGTLVSISLGQKNKERAEHLLGNGFTLLSIVGVITAVLGLVFLKQIMVLIGTTEQNVEYAYNYLRIILFFIIFQFIGYGLNGFIRSEGNPFRAMLSMIVGAVTNLILDPIFIFGFGLGVKGAAIATGISFMVSAVWNFHYFFKGKGVLRFFRKHLKPDLAVASAIIKIGAAPFLMQIVASAIGIVFNNQIKNYSSDQVATAQAAIGVIQGFMMIFFMPILGINMGAQPIIGYNYGAQKFDRVKKTLKFSLIGALILTSTCFLLCQVFPGFIFRLFNSSDPQLVAFGSRVMRIIILSFPVLGFYVISSNYFQAIGNPKKSMLLGISRPVFFLIPLLIILPRFMGLDGLWIAGPLADVGSALFTAFFIWKERQLLNRKQEAQLA